MFLRLTTEPELSLSSGLFLMSLVLLHRSKDVGRAMSGSAGLMSPLLGVRYKRDRGALQLRCDQCRYRVYRHAIPILAVDCTANPTHKQKLTKPPPRSLQFPEYLLPYISGKQFKKHPSWRNQKIFQCYHYTRNNRLRGINAGESSFTMLDGSASPPSIDLSFGSLDELVGDEEGNEAAREGLSDTERLAGLNHMLLALGLPQMRLQDSGSIIKAVSSLLGMREQDCRRRRGTEEKLARIQSDNKILTGKVKRLEDRVVTAQDRVKEAEARLRRAERDFHQKLSGAMQERDDWERAAHQYRGRDRQKEVENRKLAQQYVKLQRQASEMLIEKRSRLSSGGLRGGPKIRMSCPPTVAPEPYGDGQSGVTTPPPAAGGRGPGGGLRNSLRLSTGSSYSHSFGESLPASAGQRRSVEGPARGGWQSEDPSAGAADVTRRRPHSRGLSPESIHQSLLAEHHPASGAWAMFDPLTSIYPNTTSLDDTGSV
ncbi:hypothetical protein FOZ63_009710, partial [Perkinsus olseni]